MEQAEQDCQYRTAKKGLPGQGCQDRAVRTEPSAQECKDKTTIAEQIGKDSQKRAGRTRQPEDGKQNP